jgi:hypothetical protein
MGKSFSYLKMKRSLGRKKEVFEVEDVFEVCCLLFVVGIFHLALFAPLRALREKKRLERYNKVGGVKMYKPYKRFEFFYLP